MTSCVSYFAATLIPCALSSAEASLCCREVAGRKKKKVRGAWVLLDLTWPAFCRTSWQRFLDLRFCHPVWLNQCQYRKLLLVFFQRVKKGQLKDTRQDTTSSGHFYHSRKMLLTWSWSKHFDGLSETKLARTTWPKTHWPRRIMRPCEKATADSCSVQSFAIVKTNSSLLRTVCFVPEERQPLHFL